MSYDGELPSICNGKGGGVVGCRLDGVSARAMVGEGRDGRKGEIYGKGSIYVSGVSGGSKNMFRKGDGLLQMKRVVVGVLGRFKVVSAMADNVEPVFVSALTSKMKGGFSVKIEERK
ncbi:hypothetical protein Tco_1377377 [Tanacetum coccineum]